MHDICFPAKKINKPTEKGKVLEAESASAVNKPAALQKLVTSHTPTRHDELLKPGHWLCRALHHIIYFTKYFGAL